MIDDFLLVTTDFSQADKFLQVMQAGMPSSTLIIRAPADVALLAGFPDYGCHIASEKSLASFRPTKNPDATTICADRCEGFVQKSSDPDASILSFTDFTYCGFAIDTRDLDISIDLSRKFDMRRYRRIERNHVLLILWFTDSKDAFSAKYVRHIGQAFRQWLCRCDECCQSHEQLNP